MRVQMEKNGERLPREKGDGWRETCVRMVKNQAGEIQDQGANMTAKWLLEMCVFVCFLREERERE
jgi:hypothetical protein